MKVLAVHNRYREPGGEDAVFAAETALLRRHGHAVTELLFDNAEIPDARSLVASARLAAGAVWSPAAAGRVRAALRESGAEIAHFHNTLPLVSPAAYAACRREGVAVVQTLHNYRLLCPNALFYRDGGPCEDCLGRTSPWPSVLHACYRGSRPQTAAVALMLTTHRLRGIWRRDVDLFVAVSEFSRRKFVEGGLPPDRVVVKPNFLDPDLGPTIAEGDGFLFVGRLVDYKGIGTLLRAWEGVAETDAGQTPVAGDGPIAQLRIVGDGPLTAEVTAVADRHPAVAYLGRRGRPEVVALMRGSRALVFPSELYEGFPVTLVEAFACGLPVVASRHGAMADIVEDGRTGLLFTPGDAADLAAKVAWARAHAAEMRRMGAAARAEYEAKYTAERNHARLMAIYRRAATLADPPAPR